MSVSKKNLLIGALLVILIAGALFNKRQTDEGQLALANATAKISILQDSVRSLARVISADSILFSGDLPAARKAYQTAAANDSLAAFKLASRLQHIASILRTSRTLDTLRQRFQRRKPFAALPLPASTPLPPLVSTYPDGSLSAPPRVDSVRLALHKAQADIRRLEQLLSQRKTINNYLTFMSGAGNETYYVGEVSRGKADGNGVALLSTGSRYEGEWMKNQKHGQGTFYWNDGAYYEGSYRNDHRNGKGTYHFPDGSKFVGEWRDDVRQGPGVYYNKKGKPVTRGVWDNDQLVKRKQKKK